MKNVSLRNLSQKFRCELDYALMCIVYTSSYNNFKFMELIKIAAALHMTSASSILLKWCERLLQSLAVLG